MAVLTITDRQSSIVALYIQCEGITETLLDSYMVYTGRLDYVNLSIANTWRRHSYKINNQATHINS